MLSAAALTQSGNFGMKPRLVYAVPRVEIELFARRVASEFLFRAIFKAGKKGRVLVLWTSNASNKREESL